MPQSAGALELKNCSVREYEETANIITAAGGQSYGSGRDVATAANESLAVL